MKKVQDAQQSLLTVVDGTLDRITEKVALLDEAKDLSEKLKAENASLQPEEKASILEGFINSSSNVRVIACKDGSKVISGTGMIGFNVASTKTGRWVWVIKAFDADANVVFQAYGSKQTVKLWKLTPSGVKRITKVEA